MTRRLIVIALILTALLAAACGSDDEAEQQTATARESAAAASEQAEAAAQQAAQQEQTESEPAAAQQSRTDEQTAAQEAAADDAQSAQAEAAQEQAAEQTQSAPQSAAQATAQATASVSFTDDRGTVFTPPDGELSVVAEASVAAALLEFGVELTGVFGQLEDAEGNPYGGADFSGIQSVGGDAYGEINLEALAELQPDAVVTISWGPESYWWINADLVDEITSIAPLLIVAVSDGEAGVPAPQVIARLDELSVTLGGSGATDDSKADFAAAEAAVRDAAAANPGITLMFASASTDTFYIADPPAWPDLSYYVDLGVEVLRTETTEGGYWEYLSLESIDKYNVDHILLDDRDPGQARRLQADVPLWNTLPAVQAEQVSLWPISGRVYTYDGIAVVLRQIVDAISSSTDVG